MPRVILIRWPSYYPLRQFSNMGHDGSPAYIKTLSHSPGFVTLSQQSTFFVDHRFSSPVFNISFLGLHPWPSLLTLHALHGRVSQDFNYHQMHSFNKVSFRCWIWNGRVDGWAYWWYSTVYSKQDMSTDQSEGELLCSRALRFLLCTALTLQLLDLV